MKAISAILFTVFLVSSLCVTPELKADTKVDWVPSKYSGTIIAGDSTETVVRLTVLTEVDNLQLFAVPEIAPFVSVEPSEISNLVKNQVVDIRIMISAPEEELPNTFEGVIHARTSTSNKTLSRPFPIQLFIEWETTVSQNDEIAIDAPPYLEMEATPPDSRTILFTNPVEPREGVTVDWYQGNPEFLHIFYWAENENWPFPDHWTNYYSPSFVAGHEVLQSNQSGSILFTIDDFIYSVTNGIGIDPLYLDPLVFQMMIDSLEVSQ